MQSEIQLSALMMIADALGVPRGTGCNCAYCGNSPFDQHSNLSAISDAVLALRMYPHSDTLCAGCRAVLEGKPGSDPPLRMKHILCTRGEIVLIEKEDLRGIIVDPPEGEFVVSWATSKKKHHLLHAGISTASRQLWGSDSGTIVIMPEHRAVLLAVEALIVCHSRRDVLSGNYSSQRIAVQGTAAWVKSESMVAPYRGQRVLDLLCAAAHKMTSAASKGEDMVSEIDDQATMLLFLIARGSSYRVEHGVEFWSSYYRSRIERHNHRTLNERISRLMDDLGCNPATRWIQTAMTLIQRLNNEECAQIEAALCSKAALLVALAFSKHKSEKEIEA